MKKTQQMLITEKNGPPQLLTYDETGSKDLADKGKTAIEKTDSLSESDLDFEDDKVQIKSDSLVKFEACKLATFSRLELNTNLNLPPSNWLTNDFYGLKQVVSHPSGFSRYFFKEMFEIIYLNILFVFLFKALKWPICFLKRLVMLMLYQMLKILNVFSSFHIHKKVLFQWWFIA